MLNCSDIICAAVGFQGPAPPLSSDPVHPSRQDTHNRTRRRLLLVPPGAQRAQRRQGPPAHPSQPRQRLLARATALARAVRPDPAAARPPGRAGAADLPGRGRAACPAHRRATAHSGAARRRRAPRHADGGREHSGANPPALGRRRGCRAVGHGAARPRGPAGAAGLQRHAARAGHGQHHRAHGGTGV